VKTLRALVLISLLLAGVTTQGQSGRETTGSISGQVVGVLDGQPVAGLWVEIDDLGIGILTDSLGYFSFRGLKPGVYRISIVGVGRGTYRDLSGMEIEVVAGKAVSTRIELPERKSEAALFDKDSGLGAVATDVLKQMALPNLAQKTRPGSELNRKEPGDRTNESVYGESSGKTMPPYPFVPNSEITPYPSWYDHEYEDEGYPHDMFFRDYGTNGFVDPRRDRLSTFAVDVDDASYQMAKSYLERGLLPPSEAIRVEEFINHFDYGYNPPEGEKFRIFAELTPSPFDPETIMLKLGIKGREIGRAQRLPMNLTLVIDESGSMAEGRRLELVKQAVRTLIEQLDGHDRVGVVAYSSQARVILEPTSAERRKVILRAIDGLSPNGRTNAEAGLELGYRMAGRQFVNGHSNLVVLFSDGVANVGCTGPDEIMSQIRRFARGGISLHTYGVGMGNYNDVLLEQLAQKGNGHYAYINSYDQIQSLFVSGFVARTELLARDVKVQVEFDPKAVKAYRLLGYENRAVPDERFRDNRQDGGEVGAGHEVTALYELKLGKSRGSARIAELSVRWKDANGVEVSETSRTITFREQFQPLGGSRPELRLAMVSARFAELLKGTREQSDDAYRSLLRAAEPLERELPGEQTTELVSLIRAAWNLEGGQHPWIEKDRFSGNYRN